jgi:hypothetical protein
MQNIQNVLEQRRASERKEKPVTSRLVSGEMTAAQSFKSFCDLRIGHARPMNQASVLHGRPNGHDHYFSSAKLFDALIFPRFGSR